MLVDALKQIYVLPELLAAMGLARSSYFYHRARLWVADRHADARRVIADIFELNLTVATDIAESERHWAGSRSSSRRRSCVV